jgi:hypothetical protein
MAEQEISPQDLEDAFDQLRLMEFPPPEGSRAVLMNALDSMCPHKRALEWLISELVNRVSKWPGLAEVRGLLCRRFDAKDGIDRPWCSLPGYTNEEAEAKHFEEHKQLTKAEGYIADEVRDMLRLTAAKLKQIPEGRKPA